LLAKIIRQVCPNFLNDPYKNLNRVRQHTTIDGNPVTQTIRQYHDQIQLVISTFDKSLPSCPANPFRTFMDNLSPEIKNKVEQNNFRLHTQTVSTSPHDQVNLIQEGYKAANLPEKELSYHPLTDLLQSPAFLLASHLSRCQCQVAVSNQEAQPART
jgi:hypothetical protein